MTKKDLQRIENRLAVQRELIAHAEREFLEGYWRKGDTRESDYLYKLWQQAINEYNGMAEIANCLGMTIENMDAD